MAADAGLEGGLLIGADHVLAGLESLPFELAGVEIEDAAGLGGKLGVQGKIQLRCRQGRMASSDNHCQMVVPEMLAASPRLMTSA